LKLLLLPFHAFIYSFTLILLRPEAQAGEAEEAFIVWCQPFIKSSLPLRSGIYCPYCWCSM